jgi:hypothetical protein
MVVQRQIITLSITVVMRLLNGSEGAIEVLDKVRAVLIGFNHLAAVEKYGQSMKNFLASRPVFGNTPWM